MKKIISLIISAAILISFSITALAEDAETVGGQITLTQFLGTDLVNTKNITMQTDAENAVAVDKNTFFTLADGIVLTSSLNPQTIKLSGVYITAEKNDGAFVYAYICEDGGADKYSLSMSRLPYALYTANDLSQISKLTALAGNSANAGGTDTNAQSSFGDINGHWAEAAIKKWQNKGIITGYPDGTFKPENSVTRAELAKIITLAFDLQEKSELDYSDIDKTAWYYEYLQCSSKYIPVYALAEEYENNLPFIENREWNKNGFLPETDEIRMHVAETLVEIKKEKDNLNITLPSIQDVKDSVNKTFNDAYYLNLYANHGKVPENVSRMFNYTYLANELGIMQGNDTGDFLPYNKVTRAELITMLDRILTK